MIICQSNGETVGVHDAEQTAYDEATKVSAVDGEVVLDGPDGVGLSMTPQAAAETGRRLMNGAAAASRQAEAVAAKRQGRAEK